MGVKWFTKSLFFSLGLVLLLIMFFSVNSSVFSLSQDKAGAYAGCGDSIINFIGKNNDTIYSVNLPADKSLNDLEKSNLLKNSDFTSGFKDGFSGYFSEYYTMFSDNWFNYYTGYNMSYNNDGLNIKCDDKEKKTFFISQYLPNFKYDTDYSFSCVLNNEFFKKSLKSINFVPDEKFYEQHISLIFNSISIRFRFKGSVTNVNGVIYPANSWFLDIYFRSPVDTTISYLKLEYGEKTTPYYSSDYVQKLYGGKLDGYIWSMSPVNYTPYDFDKHTPSTSLHYVKNKPIFSLVDTWNRYVLLLNNQSSTTQKVLQLVREKWSHILEISDNMSNIFSSSSSSSPFDNPSGVLNIGGYFKDKVIRFIGNIFSMIFNLLVLVFYFFILVISPVIDMFSYLVAIIIGGDINSWSFLN